MRRTWWLAALAVAAFSGAAVAQEANAAIAAENGTLSMKNNAVITVSGQFDLGMWVRNVEGNADGVSASNYNVTEYGPDTADLTLTVKPTENAYLTVTMDLDAAWNAPTYGLEQDDFLKEMYFTFENVANTGFGVKAGKMAIPFGYDKDELLVSPYLDGYGESAFNRDFNGYPSPIFNGAGPWLVDARSTYTDRTFAITPFYNWCDKLLIEASLFQNADARDVNGRRRSNDDMFFKSMALKLTWTPIENLVIQASGMTRYNDSAKDLDGLTRRMYATSLSADYTFQVFNRDLNLFAEWQHAWNPAQDIWDMYNYQGNPAAFLDNSKSDDVHFGLSYQLTNKVKLFAQGEWLRQVQDYNNAYAYVDQQELWRAVLAVQYQMCSGIVLEGGWQHEWLKDKTTFNFANPPVSFKRNYDADTFFAGIRYTF